MALMLAPVIYLVAGLALWAVAPSPWSDRFMDALLLVFMASPLVAGLVVAGVTFRNGDNPRAAGWATGAVMSTAAAVVLVWLLLRNARFGF